MKFKRWFHYFEARADNGNLAGVTIAGVDTLRNHTRTSSQLWLDSVVPLGESFVALQSK
jgi:hypothetical protein